MAVGTSKQQQSIEKLAALLHEKERLLAEREKLITQKDQLIAHLEHNLDVYRRLAFGPSSEKRKSPPAIDDTRQGNLFAAHLLAEAEQVSRETGAEGEIELAKRPRPRKKAKRRAKFPEHVPHFKTTYELPELERVCSCGEALQAIGEDVSKELERIETTIVHEIARKKYACLNRGDSAKTASGPPRAIEKGLLGRGFLAHVIAERFQNHMPYHRQEKKYESEGLSVSRTVLERSSARCAELLMPIYDQIGKQTLSQDVIFTDDTPVKMAKSSKGASKLSRIWGYFDLEGRHYFVFTESRKRDEPLRVLSGFRGHVHAVAYVGYDRLFVPDGAKEVACWAHTRRKYLAAESEEPDPVEEALDRIRALYQVERDARDGGLSPQERYALRQKRSPPVSG